MRSKGFRFPSPYARNERDDEFRLFESADPEDIINPWPQLVDPTCWRLGSANPLIKTMYIPTTRRELLCTAGPNLKLQVCMFHELSHLYLDFTPAKELARVHLAEGLKAVDELIDPAYGQDSWDGNRLQNFVSILLAELHSSQIVSKIVFPEELLATTLGFAIVARELGRNDDIEAIERDWRAAQTTLLGRAFDKYYDTYKEFAVSLKSDNIPDILAKIAKSEAAWQDRAEYPGILTLANQDDPNYAIANLYAKLGIYLEPLIILRHIDTVAPDGSKIREKPPKFLMGSVEFRLEMRNCIPFIRGGTTGKRVASFAELLQQEDLDSVCDFLVGRVAGRNETLAWQYVIGAMSRQRRDSWAADQVWMLARGPESSEVLHGIKRQPDRISLAVLREYAYAAHYQSPRSIESVIMTPRKIENRWYICPTQARQTFYQKEILFLEAVRQQIVNQSGFQCPIPLLDMECREDRKEGFGRLVRWANEGQFGEGQWSQSPCETCERSLRA